MIHLWRTRLIAIALFTGIAGLLLIGTSALFDQPASDAPSEVMPVAISSAGSVEMDPDNMEAALATEQARQEAMQAIHEQLSKPFAEFTKTYDATISERQEKAVLLVQAILVPGSCNVSGLERVATAPDEFVRSKALKDGKNELEIVRTKLVEEGQPHQFDFSSDIPPTVTNDVIGLLERTTQQIGDINSDYAQFCTDAERRISELPTSDAAKIMAVSTDLQSKHTETSKQVEQLIDSMNREIDAIDTALVNWLADPVGRTQTGSN